MVRILYLSAVENFLESINFELIDSRATLKDEIAFEPFYGVS